jgi:hypothetical protein
VNSDLKRLQSNETRLILFLGYIKNEMPDKTLDLFEQMNETPNTIVYVAVFNACAESADNRAIRLGNQVLQQLPAMCKNEIIVIGAMLKMLMKFGQVKDAEDLFRLSTKRNLVMYAIMMQGQ